MSQFIEADSIEAKCLQMCPPIECRKREKERLIHILETEPSSNSKNRIADKSRMIKSYNRSAAGQDLTKPEFLRPPSILFQTIDHLFNNIIHDKRVSKIALYNFIDDRLRSVKQDGIVQRLSADTWFQLLTPFIHFYVYSAYSFCEEPFPKFDQKLNSDQLVDCLTRFIKLYEQEPSKKYFSVYAEMEALYLIMNFDKMEAISRAMLLNLQYDTFQQVLHLVLKCISNNYCAVFKQLPSLSILPACLFVTLHLNKMRKRALQTMSHAYASKNNIYPITKLEQDLLFNSYEETINHCKFYGMTVIENNVQFVKRIFVPEETIPKQLTSLNEKLAQIPLSKLLLHHNPYK